MISTANIVRVRRNRCAIKVGGGVLQTMSGRVLVRLRGRHRRGLKLRVLVVRHCARDKNRGKYETSVKKYLRAAG